MDDSDFEFSEEVSALDAIHEEALKLFGSQKMSKAMEEGLALIILMARHKQDLRRWKEWSSGATILDADFLTEIGMTTVRTLSHHLDVEFPVSTVFKTEDPLAEETLVGFRWNTSYRPDLLRIHDRLTACIKENGFIPFIEAADSIKSSHPATHAQGKERLKQLLPMSVGIYLQFVA